MAVVGLVAWRVDWNKVGTALHPPHPWTLTFAVAANFASVVFKGIAWKAVVDALPELRRRRTRLHQVVSPLFVGFLFNTLLAARVGELVKVLLLRKRLNKAGTPVRGTTLVGTVVVENVVSTIVWVLFVVAIGLFLPLPRYAWIASLALGAVCVGVVVAALLTRGRRAHGPARAGSGIGARASRLGRRVWDAIETAHHGLRGPRTAAMVAGATPASRSVASTCCATSRFCG